MTVADTTSETDARPMSEIPEIRGEDPLAKFRQVAAIKTEPRGMSDVALAKVRASKEQTRIDSIEDDRFKTALLCVMPTSENLAKLIVRCSHTDEHITRRLTKLGWWISAGFKLGREIDSMTIVNFLSDLTPDEIALTDRQFAERWDDASAKKRLKSRIERGVIATEPETNVTPRPQGDIRPCKSGPKCIWVKRRKPAPAVGRSQYCTPVCGQSDMARRKRASVMTPTTSNRPEALPRPA
jgi:hypothetical protein